MTDSKAPPRLWNSLEACKLGATISTPIVIFLLGCVIWNAQRDVVQHWERDLAQQRSAFEADMKERDQVRGIRLAIYNAAAPLLNEIFAYHFYVGNWKERSPRDIIAKKREIDALIYSHRALLTQDFFDRYHSFMRESFRTAGNNVDESKIRTSLQCRRPHLDDHPERWSIYFTGEDRRLELCAAYSRLLDRVSEELQLQSLAGPAATKPASVCRPFFDVERC